MANKNYGPGAGWKRIGGAVWERGDGVRIHMLGLCRTKDGLLVDEFNPNQTIPVSWFTRINGGNRRRGLMAWAASLQSQRELGR